MNWGWNALMIPCLSLTKKYIGGLLQVLGTDIFYLYASKNLMFTLPTCVCMRFFASQLESNTRKETQIFLQVLLPQNRAKRLL